MLHTIRKYIPHTYIVLMSYILSTHYLFQWWNSLILAVLLMVGLFFLRKFLIQQTIRFRFITLAIILLVLIFVPKHSNTSTEYINCAYKPFEIIDIENDLLTITGTPTYFEDDNFKGVYSYNETVIEVYTFDDKENHEIEFIYGDSEIDSVTYFDGSLYISGFNILENPTDDINLFSIIRYDLETQTQFTSLETSYYLNAHTLGDNLYVYNQSLGVRTYDVYNETGLIDILYPQDEYILASYRYNEFTVIVTNELEYELYKNDTLVDTLYQSTDLSIERYVVMDEDGIYIVSEEVSEGQYKVLKYTYEGNKKSTSYRVDELNDYVVLTDNYTVKNNGFKAGQFLTLSSTVVDEYDREICNETFTEDMKIYKLNDKLYGEVDDTLYEIEEKTYSVPFKYNDPQSGFFYTLAIISVLVYMFKKDRIDFNNFRNFRNPGFGFDPRSFNINDFVDGNSEEVYDDYEN